MLEVTIKTNSVEINLLTNPYFERIYLDHHHCLQDLPEETSLTPAHLRMPYFSGSFLLILIWKNSPQPLNFPLPFHLSSALLLYA